MRHVWQTLAAIAVLGALAGGTVVAFGLYNVSARVGHLPGVSWLLHTTFRNSVRLRAEKPDDMPDLRDPALIELGARHYDTACRTCHAAPGEAQSATAAAMVPAPPHLDAAVQDWQPHHLHWIVANGVKMTGMPPWPAQRDDDVWPVVAFLTSVQRGMTDPEYTALTRLPEGKAPQTYCLGCHGQGGSAHVPPLGHQSAAYLEMSLRAYLDGTRASGIMAQAVGEVSPEALDDLALWFAQQTPEPGPFPDMPAELVERGRALAHAATADADVPACAACHGPNASEASELFPVLTGLPAPYLRAQLFLWRETGRGGSRQAELMRKAAQNLDDSDISALVAYYATLQADESDMEHE
ncbi:class I triheme cytochrome c [Pelagivirga sediminicola]|uniref:Class I triheme cytochrome c n=1 Tax=Pelagivirga sediminicola TaxID=2170575 RepID=A0A2T7G9B2_9RHOB|nr:c-type cytochrome [Pelagivirga sediminicola]PVA11012.1 class I triheme cytochrome c [Pelagivirga sediminicola]